MKLRRRLTVKQWQRRVKKMARRALRKRVGDRPVSDVITRLLEK